VTVELRAARLEGQPQAGGAADARPWDRRLPGRRRRSLTKHNQAAAPVPDLLGGLFDPEQVDVAWCGDLAYVPTDEGWFASLKIELIDRQHYRTRAEAGPRCSPGWPGTIDSGCTRLTAIYRRSSGSSRTPP
jgi:hypothetical protein